MTIAADECIHGMDPSWCAICKHPTVTTTERPVVEATFRAKFDGDCPGCDLPISTGQVIHRLSNERYVHDGCQS